MAFPPVPFQEWFLRQTSTGNAALNAYVARVKADGGVVEAIGCVPQAVWDWAAPSFVGLLDLYPNAAAAYSFRKLRAAYSGSAVRVRESGGNTEADIGFTSAGELDTAALLSHCGANDGFVTVWYDQSLSNDATQSTAANQPKIVSSGSLVTEGTSAKPAIDFDGTDDYLTLGGTNDAGMLGNISVFSVNKAQSGTQGAIAATGLSAASSPANDIQWALNSRLTYYEFRTSDGTSVAIPFKTTASYGSQILVSATNDESGNAQIFIDGSGGTPVSAVAPMNDAAYPLEVGRDPWRSSLYFTGTMQEIILYPSLPNRLGIETNINDYFNIYP